MARKEPFLKRKLTTRSASIAIACALIIVALLYLIPTNLYIIAPGTPVPVAKYVTSNVSDPNTGTFLLTPVTIFERSVTLPSTPTVDANPIMLVRALLTPNAQIRPLDEVVGPNVSAEQYSQHVSASDAHSTLISLIAALRAANESYTLEGDGVAVAGLTPNSSAIGLEKGDIIVGIDGIATDTVDQLVVMMRLLPRNGNVTLEVKRDNHLLNVTTPILNGSLGLVGGTLHERVKNKDNISITLGAFHGSSGDLLLALDAYSRLTGTDLTRNRTVSGTGTLLANGSVVPVDGAGLKAYAASRKGVQVFFVPEQNMADVDASRYPDMRIIPVKTLTEAIDALSSPTLPGK